jgi:hypothetical protein
MKVLKSGVEMTPGELIASKAGKACACSCQGGLDTGDMHGLGAEETICFCGCLETKTAHDSSYGFPHDYPY